MECLMRFQPTENEIKILRQFEKERKPLESLTDEDRFMMQFSKIERLMQKMTIMAFIGNFCESIQMLTPVSLATKCSRYPFYSSGVGTEERKQCCTEFRHRLRFPTATSRRHCSVSVHQVFTEAKENSGGDWSGCVWTEHDVESMRGFPFYSSSVFIAVLQIILALGNYMNSSKRGAVYGFKLQSLDLVNGNRFPHAF